MVIAKLRVNELYEAEKFHTELKKLPKHRQEKILEVKNDKARAQKLAGQILLNYLLNKYWNIDLFGEDDDTNRTELGKPYLIKNKHISFNIAHSSNYAVCAVCESTVIGIDIEEVEDKINKEKFAKRFFSDKENEFLECSEGSEDEKFLKIWTRKESYLKYTGEGLTQNLKNAATIPDPRGVQFFEYEISDDCGDKKERYIVTVCANRTCEAPENIELFSI